MIVLEEDNVLIESLVNKLNRKLTARGFNIEKQDLCDEIWSAIGAVNSRRRFVPTSDCLYDSRYEDLIIRLSITSIAKWGAEGESSHSENGVSRAYEKGSEYPESMLSEVIPLGKVGK